MFKTVFLLTFLIASVFGQSPVQRFANMYLRAHGYLNDLAPRNGSVVEDKALSDSLKEFQREFGLNETGNIDQDTLVKLVQFRCGSKDVDVKTEDLDEVKWESGEISYCFSKYPTYLKEVYVDSEAAKAFNYWGKHIDSVFYLIRSGCDIEIRFVSFKALDIPLPEKTYGFYFYPGFVRKIYMNDDLQWSIEGDEEINLRSALIHQIGHALGIGHKSFESIMSPIYKESDEKVTLSLMENDPASTDFDLKYSEENSFCNVESIDAIFVTANERYTYIFKDLYYWKTLSNNTFLEGYPRLITDRWADVTGTVDAAYQDERGFTYIFSNGMIWKYFENLLDHDYPKMINDVFPNIENVQFVLQNMTHTIVGGSSIFVYARNRKYDHNLLYLTKYKNFIKNYKVYAQPNFYEIKIIDGIKYDTMSFEDAIETNSPIAIEKTCDLHEDYDCLI